MVLLGLLLVTVHFWPVRMSQPAKFCCRLPLPTVPGVCVYTAVLHCLHARNEFVCRWGADENAANEIDYYYPAAGVAASVRLGRRGAVKKMGRALGSMEWKKQHLFKRLLPMMNEPKHGGYVLCCGLPFAKTVMMQRRQGLLIPLCGY